MVEEPEGRFRYDWVDIANGFGRYAVPIRKQQVPRLAVHFLLMRGRLPGPAERRRAVRPGQADHAGGHEMGSS